MLAHNAALINCEQIATRIAQEFAERSGKELTPDDVNLIIAIVFEIIDRCSGDPESITRHVIEGTMLARAMVWSQARRYGLTGLDYRKFSSAFWGVMKDRSPAAVQKAISEIKMLSAPFVVTVD